MKLILTLMVLSVSGGDDMANTQPIPSLHRKYSHRKRRWRKAIRPYNAKLERMAWCESRGDWHINTGNGYYGGLQFDKSTWRSVGGRGLPHHHSKTAQKYRAVKLIRIRGYAPWPHCGYV